MVGIKKRGIEKGLFLAFTISITFIPQYAIPISLLLYLGVAEDPQTFLKRLTKILLLILWSR
jgi:hypothetical protein